MEHHQDLCSLRACRVSGRLDVQAAVIATASVIASSAQEPTLPASTKRLRSSGFQVRSTMQLSHYIALTSQYEANRRIRHDILHHVNTIR